MSIIIYFFRAIKLRIGLKPTASNSIKRSLSGYMETQFIVPFSDLDGDVYDTGSSITPLLLPNDSTRRHGLYVSPNGLFTAIPIKCGNFIGVYTFDHAFRDLPTKKDLKKKKLAPLTLSVTDGVVAAFNAKINEFQHPIAFANAPSDYVKQNTFLDIQNVSMKGQDYTMVALYACEDISAYGEIINDQFSRGKRKRGHPNTSNVTRNPPMKEIAQRICQSETRNQAKMLFEPTELQGINEYIPEKRNTKNAWDCFINSGRTKLAALDYKKFAETNGFALYVPIKFKNPNTGEFFFKILNDKMRFVVCPVDAEDLGDDEWL